MRIITAIRRVVRERHKEERGAVFILTAIAMIALLGAGAMGVDVGFSVYGSRVAQSMADTTALDLAQIINTADQQRSESGVQSVLSTAVTGVETDNGSNAHITATAGLWLNGVWSVPSQGCHLTTPPAVHPCNAVKINASQAVPQPFWGGVNLLGARSAIAYWSPFSCFSIGSYLASFNTQQIAVLNDILGYFGSASITALGYQGLANTYVSINDLISASGGVLTPSNVLTASLTPGTLLSIFKNAVANQSSPETCTPGATTEQSNALSALTGNLSWSGSGTVELCQLVSVNGSACSGANASLSTSALSAGVNVLQVLSTEAELGGGSSGIDVTSALSLGGVSSAKLFLSAIQPAQVAYGPVGTTATNQQMTADLQLNVPLVGLLDIPLSAVSGTATLATITCLNGAMQSTKINASTNLASAPVTLGGSAVATLNIAGAPLTGLSYSSSVVPPTNATMTASPPTNPQTISATTAALTYTGSTGLFVGTVSTILTLELPGVLAPTLQAAGLSIGNADVADLGTTCDKVSLVQ